MFTSWTCHELLVDAYYNLFCVSLPQSLVAIFAETVQKNFSAPCIHLLLELALLDTTIDLLYQGFFVRYSNPQKLTLSSVDSRNGVQASVLVWSLSSSAFSGVVCIVSSTSFSSSKISCENTLLFSSSMWINSSIAHLSIGIFNASKNN